MANLKHHHLFHDKAPLPKFNHKTSMRRFVYTHPVQEMPSKL